MYAIRSYYVLGKRVTAQTQFLGTLAGLSSSSNRKLATVGRAAAIAEAAVQGGLAVMKAYASAPPPMNFVNAAASYNFV